MPYKVNDGAKNSNHSRCECYINLCTGDVTFIQLWFNASAMTRVNPTYAMCEPEIDTLGQGKAGQLWHLNHSGSLLIFW